MFLGATMMDFAILLSKLFFFGWGLVAGLTLFGKVMTRITGKRWL